MAEYMEAEYNENWENHSIWILQGGANGDFGEPSRRAFVGKLSPQLTLGNRPPQLSDFDIEYEVDPQSVNLAESLRIEAADFKNDSFAIHIHLLTSFNTMV